MENVVKIGDNVGAAVANKDTAPAIKINILYTSGDVSPNFPIHFNKFCICGMNTSPICLPALVNFFSTVLINPVVVFIISSILPDCSRYLSIAAIYPSTSSAAPLQPRSVSLSFVIPKLDCRISNSPFNPLPAACIIVIASVESLPMRIAL